MNSNNEGLITIAIHSQSKAESLRQFLLEQGIAVYLEEAVSSNKQEIGQRFYVKVPLSQLNKALSAMGVNNKVNYPEQAGLPDDGKRRILVAVDYSADSIKACQMAFNIAKHINAKVKILHVYNNVTLPSHFPFADLIKDTDEGTFDMVRRKMLQFCLEIDNKISKNEWPSVNYSYSIREGFIVEEISNFIKEYQPMLVLMGTQGEHRTENNLIGSVTADILEVTNVPTLAVPRNSVIQTLDDIKHVVYLISLKDWGLNSFDGLIDFVSYCKDVKITLLHLNMKRKDESSIRIEMEKIQAVLKEKYPNTNIDIAIITLDDKMSAEKIFEDDDVSMVCVNTRKRNIFGRIFSPSFTRKVLINANKALLVLRG